MLISSAGLQPYQLRALWARGSAYVFVAALFGAGVWFFGLDTTISLSDIRKVAPDRFDALWFSPEGRLQGAVVGSQRVDIHDLEESEANEVPQSIELGEVHAVVQQNLKKLGLELPADALQRLDQPVPAVSPDGRRLALVAGGQVFMYALNREGAVREKSTQEPGSGSRFALAAAFTRSGNLVLRVSEDEFEVLEPQTGKILGKHRLEPLEGLQALRGVNFEVVPGKIPGPALVVAADGRVATADEQGKIRVYQKDSGLAEFSVPWSLTAIDFFGPEKTDLLLGGALSGLHRLMKGGETKVVGALDPRPSRILVRGNRLIWGGKSLTTATLRFGYFPNNGGWTLAGIGLVGFFMGMVILYAVFSPRLRAWSLVTDVLKQLKDPAIPQTDGDPGEEDAIPAPTPPPELVRAFAKGDGIVFAGAGLSAQSGLPTSRDFAQRLYDWALRHQRLDPSIARALRAALQQDETKAVLDTLAGLLEGDLKEAGPLQAFLKESFLDPAGSPSASHRALRRLGAAAGLTTNFDLLLERALEVPAERCYTPADTEKLLSALSQRSASEGFVLHLHGMLDRSDFLKLSPSRYTDAVAGNQKYGEFTSLLYLTRTLFFVGAGLDTIEAFLTSISSRESKRLTHYALVDVSSPGELVKARAFEARFGLVVLPYRPTDGHPELRTFLESLARDVEKESGRVPLTVDEEPELLLGLELKNIGPFDDLKLDFTRGWNVLLGDNGMGKSTVLKALAVAILGKEGQTLGERLIKERRDEARIVLVGKQQAYITEYKKTGDNTYAFTCPSLRPFHKDNLLTLGFPALRALTWKPGGQAAEDDVGRPVAGDLLPLIAGDVDARPDRFKKWLQKLVVARMAEGKKGGPSTDRLSRFEALAKTIATGAIDEIVSADPEREQVIVRANGSEIPIEALSQGTQSILGWAGVLFRRLWSVAGASDPLGAYALVLIDEIDAHMHPGWQQTLVSSLKKLFPKVQFVATTHSPLIVAGLKKEEVRIFSRPEASAATEVRTPRRDLKGMRIDQILTSTAFGLGEARDDGTQNDLARYAELISKLKPTAEDQKDLQELAARLKPSIPAPHENERAAEAFKLLRGAIKDQIKDLPEKERDRLLGEVKSQLHKGMGGTEGLP